MSCPRCNGTGEEYVYLEFTLDGLLVNPSGRLYILERKTYGSRPNKDSLDENDQFVGYLWGLQQLGLGMPIGGIAYDGAWKRKVPPKGSSLEDLFLRLFLMRNQDELDWYGNNIQGIALDMYNDPHIYYNKRWEGCWDCGLREACNAKMRGEDEGHILRSRFMVRPKEENTMRAPVDDSE
jgi:hypothetical protein